MKESFIIRQGNIESTLESSSQGGLVPGHISSILRSKFSITEWDNSGHRPIRVTHHLYVDNKFYTGLTFKVVRALREMGYECSVKKFRKRSRPAVNKRIAYALKRIKQVKSITLRNYQHEAFIKMMGTNLSLCSIATGGGKTIVIAACMLADGLRSVLVCSSITLAGQLRNAIQATTGRKVGIIGGGKFEPYKWTVAVIDSLLTGRGLEFMSDIEAIYIDEVQDAGANSFIKLVKSAGKSIVRRGFSGTTYRNDEKSLYLPALTGPIKFHIGTSELIKLGWLANVKIVIKKLKGKKYPKETLDKRTGRTKRRSYATCYYNTVIYNKDLNKFGVGRIRHAYLQGKRSLGIYKNVEKHLPILEGMLRSNGIQKHHLGVIHGKVPSYKREEILRDFADGKLLVLLLSVGTGGAGIDLPGEVVVGVNFFGGASENMVRQALGRLLRKPKDPDTGEVDTGKKFSVIWYDFNNTQNEYMHRNSKTRLGIFRSEPEFKLKMI